LTRTARPRRIAALVREQRAPKGDLRVTVHDSTGDRPTSTVKETFSS